MKLITIFKYYNIYTLKQAAQMLSISENTLRDQCQAGTRDAMCFAGKLWLVRLPKANVTLDT